MVAPGTHPPLWHYHSRPPELIADIRLRAAAMNAPHGTWGVPYDLYQRKMEDRLGSGWAKKRGVYTKCLSFTASDTSLIITEAKVYREIIKELEFQAFIAHNIQLAMLGLREIRPRGILATVVRRLQMFRVPTICLSIRTKFDLVVSTHSHC
jgi:hypothetical protein